jgi:glycosyltransferase involved in cell wall biosynthesis
MNKREPGLSGTVSVIIPVLNGQDYIAEAVNSALLQGAVVGEVVVVNDGSTDKTAAIVRALQDDRVKLIDADKPRGGVAAARNTGIAAASGEWLHFLDADDRLRAGALERLIDVSACSPGAVGVYGDYRRMRADGHPLGQRNLLRFRQKPSGDILTDLLSGNFIATGVILIRTEVMRRLNGFTAGLRYAEDWYAWCRLAASGPVIYVPGVQVFDYRMHDTSATMKIQLSLETFRPALEAIFGDPLLMGGIDQRTQRQLRKKAETFLRTYMACQKLRSGRFLETLGMVAETVMRHPRQTPYVLSRTAAAAIGL